MCYNYWALFCNYWSLCAYSLCWATRKVSHEKQPMDWETRKGAPHYFATEKARKARRPSTARNQSIFKKKEDNDKCWQGRREMRILIRLLMVIRWHNNSNKSLWKVPWQFLKRLNTNLPHNPKDSTTRYISKGHAKSRVLAGEYSQHHIYL